MVCAKCGTENQANASFCAKCGATLSNPVPAESPPPAASPLPAASMSSGPSPATSQPHTGAPSTEQMMTGLQHSTERLEAMAKPYEQRLAPVQDLLTPLEGIGKQMLAWIGSALIIIGLFLPVKTFTVSVLGFSGSGSDSYWALNSFETIVFLVLALAAAGLAYLRMYIWLWLIGAFLFVFFLFGFINSFSSGVSSVGSHPSWGWILLIPGVLALLAAAAMRDSGVSSRI